MIESQQCQHPKILLKRLSEKNDCYEDSVYPSLEDEPSQSQIPYEHSHYSINYQSNKINDEEIIDSSLNNCENSSNQVQESDLKFQKSPSARSKRSMDGIHPSFQKLFKKVYDMMDEIEDREQVTPTNKTLSLSKDSLSKNSMLIQRKVVNLSLSKNKDNSVNNSCQSARQRTINLKTQSRASQIVVAPQSLSSSRMFKALANSRLRSYGSNHSSKSKGISLVKDQKKGQRGRIPKLALVQKKASTGKKQNQQTQTKGKQRKSFNNPNHFFSGRRVSTKLF